MQLQPFVTEVIEELGGLVEPIEYGLCHVLIPEKYAAHFQNRTEFDLSFDYEVAQENPDSEFVTFGSFFLEQIMKLVHQHAVSTMRFAEVLRLEAGNPQEKIAAFLGTVSGSLTVKHERPVMGVWAVYQYSVAYVADEKMQDHRQVWINLLTQEVSEIMEQEQNRIVYQEEPLYSYPVPLELDFASAFELAVKEVERRAEEQWKGLSSPELMAKDISRITSYYTELLKENDRRAERKGLSEDKIKEIRARSEAIEVEKNKQLQEIYQKYQGKIEVSLDNSMLYFIPVQEYTVELNQRGDVREHIVYYDPVTRSFFTR